MTGTGRGAEPVVRAPSRTDSLATHSVVEVYGTASHAADVSLAAAGVCEIR